MQIYAKGSEAKLVERLSEIVDEKQEWSGVAFSFCDLLDEYRSDYQIKIALNMVSDLMRNEEGAAYLCNDSSVFLLCYRTDKQLIDKVIFQLRYLFMDDPLAYTADGEENESFCQFFQFDEEYNNYAALARTKMLGNKKKPRPKPGAGATKTTSSAVATPVLEPVASVNKSKPISNIVSSISSNFFNANSLLSIENDLANVDFSQVLRRQPVCAAIKNMRVRSVFDELYINIAHLRQVMRQDVDFLSNRWLFKYLTELLDLHMLAMIKNNSDKYLDSPVSLNLNIKTLMSDEFTAFDAIIKPEIKVSIVIELQASDIFEDMRAFFMARDAMHKLGYRICLDGLTDLSFPQINRENLGVDLVKLQWNADVDASGDSNKTIAKVIKACGANRVILTRCDNKTAIDYGQSLGISLFQGYYLDKLINPSATVSN